MEQNTRQELLKGVIWNGIEKVLMKGSSFVIGIILARLLAPSDYGLMGMLTIFVMLSNVIIEGGFAKALIQKKDCANTDYSTAFISNVGVSLFIYAILFISAPLVADFYEEPQLIALLRILAINFVLGSLNIVQRAKLMAAVDFKSLAQINVVSTILGGVLGILMAYNGFGIWSLVGQTIGSTCVMILLFPFYSKWMPTFVFSRESFKRLFGFGSKLMFTGFVSVIVNNISTICIGKYYKSNQLGYYTRASQFSEMIAWTINDILGTVTFPVLSKLQDNADKLVEVYKRSLYYTALIVFPVMILCALLARPLVIILLTEKWLPAVFLMQVLCLARMFTPLSAINMNILNAIGRSDLFMRLDFSKIPLTIVTLAITIPMGVKAIVIGNFISSFICFFVNAYLPGKQYGYGALQQLRDWRYIILSLLVMSAVVWLFAFLVDNLWLQLIGGGILGVVVYISTCLLTGALDKKMLLNIIVRYKRK